MFSKQTQFILSRVEVTIDGGGGVGLDIGFIDHLYTRLGTTSNYSATANLHNLQIRAKHFPACWLFTSRFLVTASNSGDSSASHAQVLYSHTPVQN
jgi:hypothetical protein